jgi:energy-coupling factor transporter transmembrane protein EcfT
MYAIRILLQIVFGLLSAVVVICLPDNDLSSSVVMLLVFALIIVLLGPCWPNQENIDRWAEKWKFQLPTDNLQVAIYVANNLGAAFCLYRVWDTYTNPTKELWRYEVTAFAIAGINGVIAFWVLLAFGCLAYGMATHAKSKKT